MTKDYQLPADERGLSKKYTYNTSAAEEIDYFIIYTTQAFQSGLNNLIRNLNLISHSIAFVVNAQFCHGYRKDHFILRLKVIIL